MIGLEKCIMNFSSELTWFQEESSEIVLKVWFPGMPHHCHVEFVKSTFSAPPQLY